MLNVERKLMGLIGRVRSQSSLESILDEKLTKFCGTSESEHLVGSVWTSLARLYFTTVLKIEGKLVSVISSFRAFMVHLMASFRRNR